MSRVFRCEVYVTTRFDLNHFQKPRKSRPNAQKRGEIGRSPSQSGEHKLLVDDQRVRRHAHCRRAAGRGCGRRFGRCGSVRAERRERRFRTRPPDRRGD